MSGFAQVKEAEKENASARLSQQHRMKVYCRVRPPNRNELSENDSNIIEIDKSMTAVRVASKQYTFDYIFDGTVNNEGVFNACCTQLVDHALSGYCGTLICYGQTGTGKTHTMSNRSRSDEGVLFRCVRQLFDKIDEMEKYGDPTLGRRGDKSPRSGVFEVRATYMQLYRDNLQDLLGPGTPFLTLQQPMKQQETNSSSSSSSGGAEVVDATQTPPLRTFQQFLSHYDQGDRHRVVAETKMNKQSSRGHSILTLSVTQLATESSGQKRDVQGQIVFVDLAGYERMKKTMVEGRQKDEAMHINLSLSALANVIHAITFQSPYIPWRNSKLTRVLQRSLSGNSITSIILNLGPSSVHLAETVNTLYFGHNAIQCKTTVHVNFGELDYKREYTQLAGVVQNLKNQLAEVQERNTTLEEEKRVGLRSGSEGGRLMEVEAQLSEALSKIDMLEQTVAVQESQILEYDEVIVTAERAIDEKEAKIEALQRNYQAAIRKIEAMSGSGQQQQQQHQQQQRGAVMPSAAFAPPAPQQQRSTHHDYVVPAADSAEDKANDMQHSGHDFTSPSPLPPLRQRSASTRTVDTTSEAAPPSHEDSSSPTTSVETISNSSGDGGEDATTASTLSFPTPKSTEGDDNEEEDEQQAPPMWDPEDVLRKHYLLWDPSDEDVSFISMAEGIKTSQYDESSAATKCSLADMAAFLKALSSRAATNTVGVLAQVPEVLEQQSALVASIPMDLHAPLQCYTPKEGRHPYLWWNSDETLASCLNPVLDPDFPRVYGLQVTGTCIEGCVITATATYVGGEEGSSRVRFYQLVPDELGGEDKLELLCEGSMTCKLSSNSVGCFVLFEYVPCRADDTIGVARMARSPTTVQPSVPTITNLRIGGEPVVGETLSACYEFHGGEEGPSIIRWHKSIDGQHFSQIHHSRFPDTELRVSGDMCHHYIRVQVGPLRADKAKGNIVVSKLVYINVGAEIDKRLIWCVVNNKFECKAEMLVDPDHTPAPDSGVQIQLHPNPIPGLLKIAVEGVSFTYHRNDKGEPVDTKMEAAGVKGVEKRVRMLWDAPHPMLTPAPTAFGNPHAIWWMDGGPYGAHLLLQIRPLEFLDFTLLAFRVFFCVLQSSVAQELFGQPLVSFLQRHENAEEEIGKIVSARKVDYLMRANDPPRPGSHYTFMAQLEDALLFEAEKECAKKGGAFPLAAARLPVYIYAAQTICF